MSASSDNEVTLQSYEDNVQAYIDGTAQTIDGPHRRWLDQVLTLITPGARILELGSAFGRDATYMQSRGFQVQTSDAVKGFVERLQAAGFPARQLNVLQDDFGGPYDLIFANAVFLHFTPAELEQILHKAHTALAPGGLLAFSVKQGDGSEWTSDKLGARRFFQYWSADPLTRLVQGQGYKIINVQTTSVRTGVQWMRFIARKTSSQ
jgi:predicted TPR repeat methyltransferase